MKVMRGVLVVLLASLAVWAGDVKVVQPEGNSAKYYRILLKNPRPGYLFERFCNSWLEHHDLKELETFLTSEKDNGASNRLVLALYYGRAGNNEKALELCSEALKSDPENQRILFYRAQLLESLGRLADAADDLDRVAEAGGKLRPDALKKLGQVYIRQGLVAAGVQSLETLLKEEPDDSNLQEEVIGLKVEEGLYDEALADCDRMAESSKSAQQKVMLSLRKSSILLRLERRDEALETLDATLGSVAAGSWLEKEILSRIGRAYRTQDDISGLAEHYTKLLEKHPNNISLLHNLISVKLEQADAEAALKHVRALVKLAPGDETVREFYVEVLRECDEYEEAIKVVSGMLGSNPDNNELRIRLAGLYYLNDQTDKIRPIMLEYLGKSPKKEYDYFRAARLMARFGDQNDATQIYLDCLAAYPDSLETREALAYHLVRRGMYPMAQTHIDAIQEEGGEGDLVRVSGMLCGAGRAAQAYEFLNGRIDDFGDSPRYLEAIHQAMLAMPQEERPDGMELAMRWLRATDSIEGLRRAAYAVDGEMRRKENEEEIRLELEAKADRLVPETYLLSHIYIRQAEQDKAQELLDAELAKQPDNVLLLRICLEQARRQNNYDRSIQTLAKLEEAAPEKRLTWIREQVDVLVAAEEYDAAMAKLEQWKALSRDNPQVYLRESRILQAQDKTDEAIVQLRRAAFRLRDFPELQESLASLYMQRGRTAEAEQVYWSLIEAEEELDEKLARFNKLVELVRWTDRMDALVDQMSDRAESNKQSVFPLLALAECYRATWNNEARRQTLLKVLELKPDDTQIMRAVAKAEAEAGNHSRSLALMRQVARLDKNERALLELASAQFRYGQPEKGLQILQQECSLDNADDLVKVGAAMLSYGGAEQLANLLAVRLAEFPDDYRIPFLYAVALEESGNLEGASDTFMRLLAVKAERPGVKTNPNQQLNAGWLPTDELPTVARLIEILASQQQVYAYRNTNVHYSQGQPPCVPPLLRQLMPYTVVHLRSINPQLGDEAREAVQLAMRQAEVPYVELVMDSNIETAFYNGQWWEQVIEKYPGDTEIAYFAALVGAQLSAQGMGITYDAEQRRRLFDLLEGPHPDGALFAIMTSDGEDEELFAKIPDLLDRCSKKGVGNQRAIAQVVEFMGGKGMLEEATPEIREAFIRYAESLPQDRFQERATVFLQLKDYAALVREIEALEASAAKVSARNRYRSFNLNSNQGYIVPLTFPPQEVFDPRLLELDSDFDPELVEALKKAKDPVVRLALLGEVLDEGEVAAIVAEVEEADTTGFKTCLLLGSWYATRQEPAKALEYLIRARHAAPSAAARKRIDGAMLDCALLLEQMTDDQKRELKAAVLRLSSGHVAQQDATVLGELRKQLGMREQKIAKVKTTGFTSFSSARNSQSPDAKVRQLLGEGKEDQALQEAAVTLRRNLPQIMMLSNNGGRLWELENCMNVLVEHEMADRFVAHLDPGDAKTPRKQLEYAVALDYMGRQEEAQALYRELLEEQPTWDGIRYRLAISMVGQPEEAAALLAELNESQLQEVANMFQSGFSGNVTAEQCMHITQMMPYLFPSMLEGRQPLFGKLYLNMVSQNWNCKYKGQSYNLPGLFDEIEKMEGSGNNDYQLRYRKEEELVEIQARRNEIFLELCGLFIANDQTAKDGFSGKERYMRFHEQDTEPLFGLAESILLRLGNDPSAAFRTIYYFSSGMEEEVGLEEYYAAECKKRGLQERYEKTLADVQDPSTKQQLELQAGFYFSSEAEFRKTLADQVKASRRNNMQGFKVGALFRAYEASGYTFDLTPTLVELLDPKQQYTLWSAGEWMRRWIETCIKMGQDEMAVAALNTFVEKLFPPTEIKKIKPQGAGSNSYFMPNTLMGRVNIFDDIFDDLDAKPETWFGLVDAVAPLLYAREKGYYGIDAYWKNRKELVPELVLETPLAADWEGFSSYSFNSEDSAFIDCLDALGSPTNLAAVVKAVGAPTFGTRLLSIVAGEKEERAPKLLGLCGEYLPQIEAASAARRKDLDHLLFQLQKKYSFELAPGLAETDAGRTFAANYTKRRNSGMASAAEQLLSGTPAKQANNTYQFNREGGAIVRQLVPVVPETARLVVDRMVEVLQLAERMGRFTSASFQGIDKDVFNAIIDSGTPNEATIAFMMEYAYTNNLPGGWLELGEAFEDHFAERIYNGERKRLEAGGVAKVQSRRLAARKAIRELDRVAAGRACPPILAPTAWLANQNGVRSNLVAWLETDEADGLAHRDVFRFVARNGAYPEGAAAMAAIIGGGEHEAIRGAFGLRLFSAGRPKTLKDENLATAAFSAAQVLPPEQILANGGAVKLVANLPNTEEVQGKLLDAWRAAQRKHADFGSRYKGITVLLAKRLVKSGDLANAALLLKATKDPSLSTLTVWAKLRNEQEASNCLNGLIAKIRKKDSYLSAQGLEWTADDAEWASGLVMGWKGEDARFAQLAVAAIPVEGGASDFDLSAAAAGLGEQPFKNENLGLAAIDLLTPLAKEGELDSVLEKMYSQETIVKYLKSGHNPGLSRLEAYVQALVRLGAKEQMAELGRLNDEYNSKPGCVHERRMRDYVRQGERDLGVDS